MGRRVQLRIRHLFASIPTLNTAALIETGVQKAVIAGDVEVEKKDAGPKASRTFRPPLENH